MSKVGIVLAGGGAKGAFQIGVLEVLLERLKEAGDEIVGVSGTSIGAMNGAFLAAGQFEDLKKIWLSWNLRNCPLIQTGWLGTVGSLVTNGYMYESEPVRAFFKKHLNVKNLLNSKVNYINTMVRLGDGELFLGGNSDKAITEDTAIAQIMASMALVPGTPSVKVGKDEYVDGGFRDTIPVKQLVQAFPNLDKIYIINLNTEKRKWNSKLLYNSNRSLVERLIFMFNDILWDENNRSDIEIGLLKFWNKEKYSLIYPMVMNQDVTSFEPDLIKESYLHGISVMKKYFEIF